MSKFEEYDLYSKNKDFLVSDGVITFNDTNGKLLALKPDVTLSIIKNSRDEVGRVEKYYYSENVYRISESSRSYKEILQTGLECIGDIGEDETHEVTRLALESLGVLSKNYTLSISSAALINAILDYAAVSSEKRHAVIEAISDKSRDLLAGIVEAEAFDLIAPLTEYYKSSDEALGALDFIADERVRESKSELQRLIARLRAEGYASNISLDYSIVSSAGYYSGVVFKGFIDGVGTRVLSGGRYDGLMKRMGRSSRAVGFAVYLDTVERLEDAADEEAFINVALPKGRLGEQVYGMFEAAGFECPSIKEPNRKLIFENTEKKLRYFWVKPSDVAIYVERGAADIGVAGKDILLEYSPDVYELLDLNLGKCRMAVAAKNGFLDDPSRTLRVATKFSEIAKKFYAGKCRDIDIIHLNGSIEIAPILGLSDVIVDIVETGKTLIENNLSPIEDIVDISARLISNKAAYSFKSDRIERIRKALELEVRR
jgi:ATP phosphoribosyltransferase regulatory subunit